MKKIKLMMAALAMLFSAGAPSPAMAQEHGEYYLLDAAKQV